MGFRENCSLIVVIDCLIVAVALNVWVLYSCEFLAAREDLYDLRVGVFRYSLNLPTNAADTGGNCERRDFDTANGYVQAAQVCGVLAPIFGIALVLLTAINRLWRPVPCGGILGSLADMGATVGTSLVWLVFRTDLCTTIPGVRCQWGTAAIGNLLALVSAWRVSYRVPIVCRWDCIFRVVCSLVCVRVANSPFLADSESAL